MKAKKMIIIGVMGPGDDASSQAKKSAYILGGLIANEGWILINGGRNVGVMDAVSRGARKHGGFVIGILPSESDSIASSGLSVAVLTGMGDARNNINVLSSRIIIACGMNPGTASEVALALKIKKHVMLLENDNESIRFFSKMAPKLLHVVETPRAAMNKAKQLLRKKSTVDI